MNFRKLVRQIKDVKPISQTAFQILELSGNPESSITEIVRLVTYDVAITANILKTVNSAYFGFRRKIESIHDAITLLGVNSIVHLVFLNLAFENFKNVYGGYFLDSGELWKHSASSAFLSKLIAEKGHIEEVNLIFTSSLLKDIGKILLDQYVKEYRDEIYGLVMNEKYSFLEAEKKVLGIDHAELGAFIAKKWNFSEKMIHLIRHHHLSQASQLENRAICTIFLADSLCSMMGIGTGGDGLYYPFPKDVLTYLELSEIRILRIVAEFIKKQKQFNNLIESLS